MSDEKMRAEFEAIAKAEQGLDLFRLPHGAYRSFATHQAWWAWQASRASLCVELPEKAPESAAGCDLQSAAWHIGYNQALRHCAAALDKAGVKYR